MLNKISAALVAALAITAQAAHGKHQHFRRHYNALNTSVVSVAPLSSTSTSAVPVPLSSAPSGTESNPNPISSVSVPLGTAPSVTTAVSTSLLPTTVSTPVEVPSNSIPLGTGPRGPPYPTVKSESISQGPIGTAPLGTKATESSKPVQPEIKVPGKDETENPNATGESGTKNPESETPEASGKVGTGDSKAPGKVTVVTSDSTYVTTVGTGSDTTVLTTTIKRTATSTLFQTVFATHGPSSATQKGAVGATGAPEEPTTTVVSTITSTNVIILQPYPSGEAPNGGEESKGGNNRVVISGSECAPQATVTVTKAAVTVTVTATPSFVEEASGSTTPSPAESSAVEEAASSAIPSPAGSSAVEEAASSSALPSFSSAHFNNGTNHATSTTPPKYLTSGFLTRTSASFTLRPTGSGAYYR